MAEHRHLPLERAIELHVLGERRQPLLGADHVGDAHQVVVHHVGQVVGGIAVALEQDLVVHLGTLEADVTPQRVADDHRVVARHGQAHHVGLAGRAPRAGLFGRKRSAAPVVAGGELLLPLLGAQRLQPLRRAEAEIGAAPAQQLLRVLPVDLGALALTVGTMRSADVRTFVPRQAQPAQRLEDHPLAGGMASLPVRVLDAEDELAPAPAGPRVVEQGDVGGPYVRVAGGGRGDARADGHSLDGSPWGLRAGKRKRRLYHAAPSRREDLSASRRGRAPAAR